ncbi:MAG: hypothetical protein HYY63_05985 [Elusimicrobia bacterium]|nr:hypothetical protein [Elusimicrobiota bacterium]
MNHLKIFCFILALQTLTMRPLYAIGYRYLSSQRGQVANPIIKTGAKTYTVRIGGDFYCNSGCNGNASLFSIRRDGTYSKGSESGTYQISGIQKDSNGVIVLGNLAFSESKLQDAKILVGERGTASLTLTYRNPNSVKDQIVKEVWIKR